MFQVESTPYDWNFRLFGTDVRVSPWFWLVSAMFGWQFIEAGPVFVVLWILCTFVSILIHEMGHVVVGRLFGTNGTILLYSFGGLAIGSRQQDARWQRILVSLAGPGAQFVLLGIVYLIRLQLPADVGSRELLACLAFLFYINLFWPLFNLLPIYPLDGGMVSRELFQAVRPYQGTEWSLWLSIGVCALIAVNSLTKGAIVPWLPSGGMIFTLFFAILAYNNYQEIQFERSRGRWDRW